METQAPGKPAEDPSPPFEIERFRSYLCLVAKMTLHQGLRRKVDPSDLVQQTLLEAHCARDRFRGRTSGEQAAWLRQILLQNMLDMDRAFHRAKREVARERSLEAVFAESTARLEACIAAAGSSPSERSLREERVLLLAEALDALPAEEQDVLIDRYCHGMTLSDIGGERGLSRNAVARLLNRGTLALRRKLKGLE